VLLLLDSPPAGTQLESSPTLEIADSPNNEAMIFFAIFNSLI
jgi:hypothetical protein